MGFILNIIISVIKIIELLIIIECLLSWVITDQGNEVMIFLRNLTDPIVKPFRNLQNRIFGYTSIDFSPAIAIIVLMIVEKIVYLILG